MKTIIATAGLLCGMVAAQEVKIYVTPPVGAEKFDAASAFVIGKDMKTRTCPGDFNTYVRLEGKNPPDKNLYYVMPKQILMPQGNMNYSIVCIKMGN